MKLLYITNVKIPAHDAQSLQVASMAKAFTASLADDFGLVIKKMPGNEAIDGVDHLFRIGIPAMLPRVLQQLLFSFRARHIVKRFKPTAIYTRDIGVAYLFSLLGYSCVYEFHKPFETALGRKLFMQCKDRIRIVAISNALKQYLLEDHSINERDICVAHDGVFLEDFENIDRESARKIVSFDVPEIGNSMVALYAGNLQSGKGKELIFGAAKNLPDVSFVIVGGQGKESERYKDSTPANVHFLGRKPKKLIPQYLCGADILLLPFTKNLKTWKYHSALKMFEYMAAGTPIVTSDIGTLTEVFSKDNAFLFSPDSEDGLGAQIRNVIASADDARRRADTARVDVEAYTWYKRADYIISFLQ